MPRIRTVKPELFKHEALFAAEKASQLPLRLGFIALFACCDREGRFRWRPGRLKLDLFPYDEIDVAQVLDALAQHGFIQQYECDGEQYGCIPTWLKHQRVNQREMASDIPAPDAISINKITTRASRQSDASSTRTSRSYNTAYARTFSHVGNREYGIRKMVYGIGKGNMEGNGNGNGKGLIVASMTRPRPVEKNG